MSATDNEQKTTASDVEAHVAALPEGCGRACIAVEGVDERTASRRLALFLSADSNGAGGSHDADAYLRIWESVNEAIDASIDVFVPLVDVAPLADMTRDRDRLLQKFLEGEYEDVAVRSESLFGLARPSPSPSQPANARDPSADHLQ